MWRAMIRAMLTSQRASARTRRPAKEDVLICNANRGVLVPIKGMPWVFLIVLGVVTVWTILLGRTKFGRHVYAIGGNAGPHDEPASACRASAPSASCSRPSRPASPGSSTRPAFVQCRPTSTVGRSCSTRLRPGDRRHQSVRRPRQSDPRGAGRHRHRIDRQRHGAPGLQRCIEEHRHRDRADRRGHHRCACAARRLCHGTMKRRLRQIRAPEQLVNR